MSAPAGPFRRRAAVAVTAVAAVSFGAALLLAALGGNPGEPVPAGANARSPSAIGHVAFVRLLRKLGVPVVVSSHDSAGRAGDRALLLLAEPRPGETLDDMLWRAGHVLLVLPKRTGLPHRRHPGWLRASSLLPAAEVEEVLAAVAPGGRVARPAAARFQPSSFELAPELGEPQLVVSDSLVPVIASDQGILLGAVTSGRVWVLADPDLIASHGLGRGDNAALAHAIVERLRPEGGAVVVDETLHGRLVEPSIWRELLSFPLVLATLAALLAAAALLWASLGRFGAPEPPPPALEPGKAFLIENTAELARVGGHSAHALARYLEATVHDVARAAHPPAQLAPAQVRDWLADVERARGVATRLRDLEADVRAAGAAGRARAGHIAAAAARIHHWRTAMLDTGGTNG